MSVKDLLKKLSKELESKSDSKSDSKLEEPQSELEEISLPSVSSVAKMKSQYDTSSEGGFDSDSETDSVKKWEEMSEDNPMTGAPFFHDKKPYYYLSENNLDHDFISQNPKIQIHLALYYISDNIKVLPFLSFIQKKTGQDGSEMYSFPGFEYSINNPNPEWKENENEQEDMESVMQDMFMNACLEHIFDIFQYKPTTESQSFSQFYKGYLKNESDCLVVFDCSFFMKKQMFQSNELPGYTWSILHELLNERKIEGIPVHPYVTEQLLNESLLYITDDKGIPIEIPYLLYGCEIQSITKSKSKESESESKESKSESESKSEESVFNIFGTTSQKPEVEPEKEKALRFKNIKRDSENTSFLLSRIEHPDYGYNYIFSSEKLDTNNVKRYVVFVIKTFYDILPKDDRLSKTGKTAIEEIYEDEDIELTNEKNKQTYFSSFYFQESGVPFWMVRSVDFFMEF